MALNMKVDATATFDFTLRDSSTDAVVTIPAFNLALLDLDKGNNNKPKEWVQPAGFDAYDLHPSSPVQITGSASSPKFTAAQKNVDNPTDPLALTVAQQKVRPLPTMPLWMLRVPTRSFLPHRPSPPSLAGGGQPVLHLDLLLPNHLRHPLQQLQQQPAQQRTQPPRRWTLKPCRHVPSLRSAAPS